LWPYRGIISAFAQRDWGKPLKTSVKIAGVSTDKRTEHLLHTNLQHYMETVCSVTPCKLAGHYCKMAKNGLNRVQNEANIER
jgi:hypothetical protein